MKQAEKFYQTYPANSKVHLINHFKTLQSISQSYPVNFKLNCENFYINAEFSHKTLTLYPQFLIMVNDEPRYTEEFNGDVVCFTGWRPYLITPLPALSNKISFKKKLIEKGIPTPSYNINPDALTGPVVVKNRLSSFGKGIRGPFSKPHQYKIEPEKGEYFEAFIQGHILKIGYWDDEAIYLEIQNMPTLEGDGISTIETLALKRAIQRGRHVNYLLLEDILTYQNYSLSTVLPLNKTILVDFRYESDFCKHFSIKELPSSHRAFRYYEETITYLGELLFGWIKTERIEHLFYTVDAILTPDNKIWVLEMNINPTVHQLAYPAMIDTLYQEV